MRLRVYQQVICVQYMYVLNMYVLNMYALNMYALNMYVFNMYAFNMCVFMGIPAVEAHPQIHDVRQVPEGAGGGCSEAKRSLRGARGLEDTMGKSRDARGWKGLRAMGIRCYVRFHEPHHPLDTARSKHRTLEAEVSVNCITHLTLHKANTAHSRLKCLRTASPT
jgi:hypothetical protein